MVVRFKTIISKVVPGSYSLVGPFVIAFAWNYYHLTSEVRQIEMVWLVLLQTSLIFLTFFLFKGFFVFLVRKFQGHTFWTEEFTLYLNELFFISSFAFLVLLFKKDLLSFIYLSLVLFVIFWRLNNILKKHKADLIWQKVNKRVFLLAGFIFVLTAIFQYTAYSYYIFDSNAKYYNIVLFRVFSLTMFWLGSFALCSLVYFYFEKTRQLFLFIWLFLFWGALFIELVNTGIVLNSGLYLSPVIFSHASFTGLNIYITPILILFAVYFILIYLSYLVFKKVILAHDQSTKRHWLFYNFALLSVAGVSLLMVGSFYNTPEAIVVKNFSNLYQSEQSNVDLSPMLVEKLKKFGLNYDLNNFFVMRRTQPQEKDIGFDFQENKPNIIFIVLESFSARLTGVYNEKYKDVTPGLNEFAGDENTVIFKKVYNASTPTITGLMSLLCSFLPPTGHQEIEKNKEMQRHFLICLPQVLKDNNYKDSIYVTAVDKEFANKDTIVKSMGVEKFYGMNELEKKIKEEPKSWGYSDHQLFPFILQTAENLKQPFFLGYSTVDTHPPFDLPQDIVKYTDGQNKVLNVFHTTDDAFAKFWMDFKKSFLAQNTILVVVADHAIFPTIYDEKNFPEVIDKMTFYDEIFLGMYLPENILPQENEVYGSGIDVSPTILHLLNLETPSSFEGYSLLGERKKYPNIIGIHEFGLYLNQEDKNGVRKIDYTLPSDVQCEEQKTNSLMTLCELKQFYDWKRQMLLAGRLW
ncbi:MAG: sulfatase-like hydrolase/transferase [Candidatus Magasanikbacteria bacterium]|nr:sulfatase-like hydrolase/transferase [Candidatus Magasanikbacteria bacterium]